MGAERLTSHDGILRYAFEGDVDAEETVKLGLASSHRSTLLPSVKSIDRGSGKSAARERPSEQADGPNGPNNANEASREPPDSAVRQNASGLRSEPNRRDSSRTVRRSDKTVVDPSAPRRKERNAAKTKRRILEAAATEFAAKGFDGARLGSIARAADVQHALIHHYFVDKEGLHAEVVRGGLAAMTEGAWGLLSQMDAPVADRNGKKRRGPAEMRALSEAFVDLLLGIFANNGSLLSILRHEARRGEREGGDGQMRTKIFVEHVAPVFEAIVARIDEMRARGEVRKDVDAKHLVLSCVAMIAFPFQEEPFITAIWPMDWRVQSVLAERKKHVVEMVLARVLP